VSMFVLEKPVAVLTSWKFPFAQHAKISFVPEGSMYVKGKCVP